MYIYTYVTAPHYVHCVLYVFSFYTMVIECTTILLCTCSDVEMALCPVRLSRYVRLMMASFRGMWEMRMSPDFVSAIIATLSISLSIHIHCTY